MLSAFDSCKQHTKQKELPSTIEKVHAANKILVPKNGFSYGFVDREGTIWFSSNGGGIYQYDENTVKHFTVDNGLSSNQVFSIASDLNDHLWFGTQNGLTKFNGKHFEHIRLPFQDTSSVWLDKVYPVINPNAVHSLASDNNNNLWIGTAGGGTYSYDGETFKSYLTEIGRKQEDSLYHNWVPSIRKDNNGNMWFASMTHGGINRFDGNKFTQFLQKDGLSDNQVRTIYCDKKGNIWIGFNGNRNSGLTIYNGRTFRSYSSEDGLCNKQIRAIFEDNKGQIWLGGGSGNVCIFDGQKFNEFTYNGQNFRDVLFIFGDLKNNIWFGGKHGIWKFDGNIVTQITATE